MGNGNIKRRNKIYIDTQKKDKECEMCGWKEHWEILHYHHYRGDKLYDINQLRHKGSLQQIKDEIIKCLLLCPNCHSWLHYQEQPGTSFK